MHVRTNGRLNRAFHTSNLKVAPVTRAIRAALAISVTLLALGHVGVAFSSGVCSPSTASKCGGAVSKTLPDSTLHPVVDLTLVSGSGENVHPNNVVPAGGLLGISATLGSSTAVKSHNKISAIEKAGNAFENNSTAKSTSLAGSSVAIEAKTFEINALGDVSIVNNGPINAYSAGVYDITAINAYSVNGDASVDNQSQGVVTATAQDGNALAVSASGYGAGAISNEGSIAASSVYGTATGVTALGYNGNSIVTNTGSISATSTNYQAVAILSASSYGNASVVNAGTVSANGGQDQTIGIEASGQLGSSVNNTGTVSATSSSATATGILAQTTNGDAYVSNTGSVVSSTNSLYQAATGISVASANGRASVLNAGHIQSINYNGLGIGIEASSASSSTVTNSGYVVAGSYQGNAIGALAETSNGSASVLNTETGYIRTVALNGAAATATGIQVSTYNGNASAINKGSVYAESAYGPAIGIAVQAIGGDVYVSNAGVVNAPGGNEFNVRGIQAFSSTGIATVVNSGNVLGHSPQHEEDVLTSVDGIRAYGYNGTSVTNSGLAYASGPWFANGITGIAQNGSVVINNKVGGLVQAQGLIPTGINALNYYGAEGVTVDNAGSIVVFQNEKCFCNPGAVITGTGIFAYTYQGGDAVVVNSGKVSVNSLYGASGVEANSKFHSVSITNSGSVSIATNGYLSSSWGLQGVSDYGGVSIVNFGDVSVVEGLVQAKLLPQDDVTGIYALTVGKVGNASALSDINISNTGSVSLSAFNGYAIRGRTFQGSVSISNAGHITVNNYFGGGGIFATSYAGGSVAGNINVDNSGSIAITGPVGASGITTLTNSTASTKISNSGDITDNAKLDSVGIFSRDENLSQGNDVTINNSGSVNSITLADNPAPAYHGGYSGHAMGIHVYTYGGDIAIGNTGSLNAQVQADGQLPGSAVGVFIKNGYGNYFGNVGIVNNGSIVASLEASNSRPAVGPQLLFDGPIGTATGILVNGTYGNVGITNTALINATANSSQYAGGGVGNGITAANGITVVSGVGGGAARSLDLDDITVSNSQTGSIVSLASAIGGTGNTAVASAIDAQVAVGTYGSALISAGHGITASNLGSLSATASVTNDASGRATATGISAVNGSSLGYAKVLNAGDISASATSATAADAYGVFATANDITVALNAGGRIVTQADGASGVATGLSVNGARISASNAGALSATFNGTGIATGASLTSPNAIVFTNSGSILATGQNAIGVSLNSFSSNTLANSGMIGAVTAAGAGIAVLANDADTTITNSGVLNGTITTGAGSDHFSNASGGVWNAIGNSSFGSGNNTFGNAGTIAISGTSQVDLGAGNTFTNAGTIDMQNGSVGDTLAIAGNFAGSGNVDLDVSGSHGTADQLQIAGDVAASSVTRVNIRVLDDPTQAVTIIPLVTVTGTSVAGNFKLGTIIQNKSFLELSDALLTNIDSSNATSDIFSLGLTVTPPPAPPGSPPAPPAPPITPPGGVGIGIGVAGLSNLGTLAVSAAPGAQSLMNSQIGTLQQRMGAVSQTLKGGLSLWMRLFGDSGKVDPSHAAGNFGQGGNFAFDQNNEGQELGLDFALTDELKAGLLLAKDEANQHLTGDNSGSSHIKGTTSGIYGTWTGSTGFYVDASYREMTFNSRLKTATGQAWLNGKSNAFNVESGQTFTLGSGLQIAPQFQYTWDQVDQVKSETASLAGFDSRADDSSRARLGLMVSKSYNAAGDRTVWTPYASLSAVREFDGKNRYSINDTFFGQTSIQGTSALVEAGIDVKIHNVALYGGVNWLDGGAQKSFFGGQVGVRYTW